MSDNAARVSRYLRLFHNDNENEQDGILSSRWSSGLRRTNPGGKTTQKTRSISFEELDKTKDKPVAGPPGGWMGGAKTPPVKTGPKVWCVDTSKQEFKSDCIKIGPTYHIRREGKLGIKFSVYSRYGTTFVALYRMGKVLDTITFSDKVDAKEVYSRIFGNVSSYTHAVNQLDKPFRIAFSSKIVTREEFNKAMSYNSWTDKARQGTKQDSTISSIISILESEAHSIKFAAQKPHQAMQLARSVANQQRAFWSKKKGLMQVCAYYPNFHPGVHMVTHSKMRPVLPLFYEYNRV